ncbi:4'-phosphopantetheinyl transferase superfamily protein [Streptomyces sp. NPDC047023]|uniref:4'-phosphopantetheinyl transferase family protein n=1 Tax=Streptomyces sp. NPDC047023 TaxID=3155139 RepID=UPI00340B1344
MRGWATAPTGLVVRPGELHVFRTELEPPGDGERDLLGLLSEQERGMAERLRRPDERRAFLSARAMTRRVLGRLLGRSPSGLEFCRPQYGRTELLDRDVWFNAAHADGTLLVAVSRDAEVGIDVQPGDLVYEESLHLALTGWERRILGRLSPSARQAFFLGLWTRKEAVLRAVGHGLSIPLDQVDVLVEDGAGAVPVPLPDGSDVVEVQVRDLPGTGEKVAAVACAGEVSALYTWCFDPARDRVGRH